MGEGDGEWGTKQKDPFVTMTEKTFIELKTSLSFRLEAISVVVGGGISIAKLSD